MELRNLTQLFKIDNKVAELTDTQMKIFEYIVTKKSKRVIMILPTQYGKSMSVAFGAIVRSVLYNERTLIVAPSEKKAKIIMGYIIEHIGDNILFRSQLEFDGKDTFERLKRERSKNRLTFKRGGEIMTLSLDSRNSKKSLEAAMGFGVGENGSVILDESSLIDDTIYASVKRMVGGKNAMLFEIGNPFYRNHFYRTWTEDNNYTKIFADYHTAIKEGRFTNEFIEEMKGEAFFDVYYECKFPDESFIDEKGYRQLITTDDIKYGTPEPVGIPKLGCDIGGGGDYNSFCVRYDNCAIIAQKNQSKDTMANIAIIEDLVKQYNIRPENINIDDIGIGRGVTDRLKEKDLPVNGVSVGSKAFFEKKYTNLKAELSWKSREWVLKGGIFVPHNVGYKNVWEQLTWIKYKVNSEKQIKIEPKEDLKKRTGKSPDYYESFMLTFYERPYIGII